MSFNTSIPDNNGIPEPGKARESAIEAGISGSIGTSRANTYTVTLPQLADALRFIRPAMGPDDELPPFFRMLQTGPAAIGQPTSPPVPFLSPSQKNPMGGGMGDWGSSAGTANFPLPLSSAAQPRGSSVFETGASPVVLPPPSNRPGGIPGLMTDAGLINSADPGQLPPGGLAGLILDYLRNHRGGTASR